MLLLYNEVNFLRYSSKSYDCINHYEYTANYGNDSADAARVCVLTVDIKLSLILSKRYHAKNLLYKTARFHLGPKCLFCWFLNYLTGVCLHNLFNIVTGSK